METTFEKAPLFAGIAAERFSTTQRGRRGGTRVGEVCFASGLEDAVGARPQQYWGGRSHPQVQGGHVAARDTRRYRREVELVRGCAPLFAAVRLVESLDGCVGKWAWQET